MKLSCRRDGPKKPRIRWGVKIGRIHSQPGGATSRDAAFCRNHLIVCCLQELNSETNIAASNGEQVPAVQLFSFALRYFKEHALKELSAQSATIIVNEDVRWVITVPAIWTAPAKQLMRQAAYEVPLTADNYVKTFLAFFIRVSDRVYLPTAYTGRFLQ